MFLGFFWVLSVLTVTAQEQGNSNSWKSIYRQTSEKEQDLVHTKLQVSFNYEQSTMDGKAWITVKPHFYATDSLTLDAKGMDVRRVAMWKNAKATPLTYSYTDKLHLRIKLDKTYQGNEAYTVFIDYTAKPEELNATGSAAIKDAKGLYFINPLGKEKNKPTQIWTQGETEASSAWFPTIDRPNQKTTEEIAMTVPAKYVTLSNGLLVSQKIIGNGLRTDTWVMNKPHSPYLFFMGVGDFAIVKDHYKTKPVNYYVEKDFEPVAKKIFGLTPEMMSFFSRILQYDYPWDKYAQMVGRDYVSGAMENTSATLHSEYLQQNARQLVDGNKYEDYISHELFHQWFGDLVTAESWSNLTVNESFANYGETLWNEYKHGRDAGDEHNYQDMQTYFRSNSDSKNLVRFHYRDKEDMFDRVTYNKGGRILHMLRNYVGDSAFFKSLHLYLVQNQFKSAEAQNLRLAFEEVTGKDLNWFFNEWYYGSGHPVLNIAYGYDSSRQQASVVVEQTQPQLFKMAVAIDVYTKGLKTRYPVWLENKTDTFYFGAATKPDLINFDGDKMLLAQKEENKKIDEYVYQYKVAGNYVDRREAVEFALQHTDVTGAQDLLLVALSDPYFELRKSVLQNIALEATDTAFINKVQHIATYDANRQTRAAAIDVLGNLRNNKYLSMFATGIQDSSYSVAGSSLIALSKLDEERALGVLPKVQNDAKGTLQLAVKHLQVLTKTDADFEEFTQTFDAAPFRNKVAEYSNYIVFLRNVSNTENFKKGVDKIIAFRDRLSQYNPDYKKVIDSQLQNLVSKKEAAKNTANSPAIDEQIKYLQRKLS